MSEVPNLNNNDKDRPPSTPTWVKISGVIAIVLVLLIVTLLLFGGGNHGPGRHAQGGETIEQSVLDDRKYTENQEGEINNDDGADYEYLEGITDNDVTSST